MDYEKLCIDIFGTSDPERLVRIAESAEKYDLVCREKISVNSRGAGRKPKVTDTEAKEMQELYSQGMSAEQIAEIHHVTRQTVYKYINLRKRWEENHCVKMRMEYMHEDQLCTVIDVDFQHKKVYIDNKTDRIILRAFGVNRHPDWEDFTDFLESRCFPRTRCQMKRTLREAGLDSYDPLRIIEETQGRMAEDHHWIRIRYRQQEALV